MRTFFWSRWKIWVNLWRASVSVFHRILNAISWIKKCNFSRFPCLRCIFTQLFCQILVSKPSDTVQRHNHDNPYNHSRAILRIVVPQTLQPYFEVQDYNKNHETVIHKAIPIAWQILSQDPCTFLILKIVSRFGKNRFNLRDFLTVSYKCFKKMVQRLAYHDSRSQLLALKVIKQILQRSKFTSTEILIQKMKRHNIDGKRCSAWSALKLYLVLSSGPFSPMPP